MAKRYTMLGEMQVGIQRFWRLPWKWKGPTLAALGFVALVGISAAVSEPPPDETNSAIAVSAETEPLDSEASSQPTRENGRESSPTVRPTQALTRRGASTPTSKPTATRTATATPNPTVTAMPSPTPIPPTPTPVPPTPTPSPPTTLTGITAGDLKVTLEDYGFDCSDAERGQTQLLWTCSQATYDGQVIVDWRGPGPTRIAVINATVFGSESLAVDFFGEFAKLPYETANPEQAASFVLSNLNSEGELQIGDAIVGIYNEIDGVEPEVYFLQIRALGEDLVDDT